MRALSELSDIELTTLHSLVESVKHAQWIIQQSAEAILLYEIDIEERQLDDLKHQSSTYFLPSWLLGEKIRTEVLSRKGKNQETNPALQLIGESND